jgi:uncharacterized LabA/DUF88 family protein
VTTANSISEADEYAEGNSGSLLKRKAMTKRVGLFADITNLYHSVGKRFSGRKLDYKKYIDKATGSDEIYRAFAYGTQINAEAVSFISCLRHFGYDPKYKRPKYIGQKESIDGRKSDWYIGMAMDVVRLIDRLDIVIIGSSDPDLVPLIQWIKEKGVRCIIMACGISKELKDIADYYIEINETLLEDRPNDNAPNYDNEGTREPESSEGGEQNDGESTTVQ